MLVDHDRSAQEAVRANLQTTGFEAAGRFQRSSVAAFVAGRVPEAPFDLVFLDPPYDTLATDVEAVLDALDRAGLVVEHGTVVVERPKSGEPVTVPEGWGVEKERAYGDTLLTVAHVR